MEVKSNNKRSKKSKTPQRQRLSSDSKSDKTSSRKQKELMRVLYTKNFQLQNGNLSYLEFVELREELARLNALKNILT